VEDNDQDGTEDHHDPDDDNDGFSDSEEIAYGSDPMDAASLVNQPPSGLVMRGGNFLENEPNGTLVARFVGVDDDGNDTLSYSLVYPNQVSFEEKFSDKNQTEIKEANELPFRLSKLGRLRTLRTFDYEKDESNYSVTVRVTDEHNTSFVETFIVHLINVVEDLDGDGTEDAYDEDRDGDGFTNEQEITQGTDPNDFYSLVQKPIVATMDGIWEENGSVLLSGQVLTDGEGEVLDFGIVLTDGISLTDQASSAHWVRGDGNATRFELSVPQSPFGQILYYRAWAKNIAGYGIGPVKKVVFKRKVSSWLGEIVELKAGWVSSPWLGTLRPYENGWLYHARLGWIFAQEAEKKNVWFWKKGQGWWWTGEEIWPYLWANRTADWLYLVPGSAREPIKLYDYSNQSYRQLK